LRRPVFDVISKQIDQVLNNSQCGPAVNLSTEK